MSAVETAAPARRTPYAEIDLRKGTVWPATVPAMTDADAINAFRRLFRWAEGKLWDGEIRITSGNRNNWARRGVMFVNPSQGWKAFAHDLSHFFYFRANPFDRPHSKNHARFETRLIREILKRGWLDQKPAQAPAPMPDERQARLDAVDALEARLDAREADWQKKLRRAETFLKKIARERKKLQRARDRITSGA